MTDIARRLAADKGTGLDRIPDKWLRHNLNAIQVYRKIEKWINGEYNLPDNLY